MKAGPAFSEKPSIIKMAFIGDVHGCYHELTDLLQLINQEGEGRHLVFVGDFTDRGPMPVQVLQLVMDLIKQGRGFAVKGNHDEKLYRYLLGRRVQLSHGLDYTATELQKEKKEFREQVKQFLEQLPFQLFLDNDQVVVAHAGINEKLQKTTDDKMRTFALYGDITGKTDEFGLPVRRNWAANYAGKRLVVYGHTPVPEPLWQNNTVNIDTGCAFGGKLTALLYPEKKVLQVQAKAQYAKPSRPFLPEHS